MHRRIAPTLVVLLSSTTLALTLPLRTATGQDQAAFRVAKTVGTPDEQPIIDAVVTRLRTKVTSDPTFSRRFGDAIAKRDVLTAKSLVATTAQVRAEQVVIGLPLKTSSLQLTPRGSYARFASAALNPWYVLVHLGSSVFCVTTESGVEDCKTALRALGYTVS